MPRLLPARFARSAVAGCAALLLAVTALILTPQAAYAAAAQFTLTTTVSIGQANRDAVVDDERGRVYTTIDSGSGTSEVTWYDIATGAPSGSSLSLPQREPTDIALSADGANLYVLYNGSETMSIVDLNSPDFTIREVTGVPAYSNGLVEDTGTGMVYVFDSTALTRVDPTTAEASAPIPISTESYPLIKDAVYDATNHMIWIAEGRAKVITGYSTITGEWVDSLAFSVSDLVVDGTEIGGRAAVLAMDESLGELHIAVNPTINDSWTRTKLVSLRVADGKFVGAPIEVGENVYEMEVNPVTHEIVTTDGFSNTVSVISPDTWTVQTAVDFTAAGITEGTGSPQADTWGLGISADGTRIFVSHPYSDRLSEIERTGDIPVATEREVTPRQGESSEAPPVNDSWDGPAAPAVAAAPSGAFEIGNGMLTWAVNTYMQAWGTQAIGDAVKTGADYEFSNGVGWYDKTTGATDIVWTGGIFIQHYPSLAFEVSTTFGNPRLQIDDNGNGELSFDVAWKLADSLQSDGYRRVTLATFAEASATLDGDTLSFTATPDFFERELTLGTRTYPNSYPADFVQWLDPQMQAWWVATGASMDPEKAPLPVSVTATVTSVPAQSPDADGDGTDSSGDASGSATELQKPDTSASPDATVVGGTSPLATTGADTWPWLGGGAALVMLGAILLGLRTVRLGTR